MLKHRIPMGLALIALAILLGWLDEVVQRRYDVRGVVIALAAAPVFTLAAIELSAMLTAVGARVPRWLAPASALAGLAFGALEAMAPGAFQPGVTPLAALWLAVTLVAVSWPRRTNGSLIGAGAAMLIFLYLGLVPASFLALRQTETAWFIIALILIAKSCDMGAFFTGKSIGRHKLIPWLSPGKTWEGLVGGVISAAVVAAGLAWLSRTTDVGAALQFPMNPAKAALMGVGLGVVAQFGDLSISLFKRDAGVKDASALLPGLGGVLDVVDSLLLIGPAATCFVAWLR